MKSKLIVILASLALLLSAGCSLFAPDEFTVDPPDMDSGGADFSVYCAIGNSLTAGYQSGALYRSTQQYGYASLLADAMGVASFEVPWIADPGIYDEENMLGHLTVAFDENGDAGLVPIPWPESVVDPRQLLENAELLAPYHNMGVPGAVTYDLLMATNADNCFTGTFAGEPNGYFDMILRNASFDWTMFGGDATDLTVLGQVALMDPAPTFLSVWIGNNELLMPATQGIGVPFYPATSEDPPPNTSFEYFYTSALGTLAQLPSSPMMVTANIPNVTDTPYFNTVPWFLLDSEGNPVDGDPETAGTQFVGYLSDDVGQLSAGDYVLLGLLSYDDDQNGTPDVEEGLGYPDAILIGSLMAAGYTQQEAMEMLPTAFPFHNTPLPGALTLVADEAQGILDATAEYNDVIDTVAGGLGIPVVDINGYFADIAAHGATYNGTEYTTEFVTGGIFSLDGVHPSNVGAALIAERFIETINDFYGSNLGLPSLPEVPLALEPGTPVKLPESFPSLPF